MVDFFEFAQMIASKIKMGEPEKELRKTFNVFDKNGDGVISSEELKTVFESIGEHLTESQINTMMAEADENHDGKLDFTGTLSIFLNFLFEYSVLQCKYAKPCLVKYFSVAIETTVEE